MTTRFEQIAAAFPLHAQRIAECTKDRDKAWLHATPPEPCTAADVLYGAFIFNDTIEGHEYWFDLAESAEGAQT